MLRIPKIFRRGNTFLSSSTLRCNSSSPLSNGSGPAIASAEGDLMSKIKTTPPSFIRLAIVGASVTLATPVFTVAGIYRIWSAVLPKTPYGQLIKTTTAVVIGGSSLTLFYQYIIPSVMKYADLIFPFALSNGLSCMLWMGVGEMLVGWEFLAGIATNSTIGSVASWLPQAITSRTLAASLLSLPAGGAVIGGLTALTTPLLWPYATKLCWDPLLRSVVLGGDSIVWLMDLYYQFLIPVGLPIGIFSGIALHSVLKPVVIGQPFVPWFRLTLPILAALIGLCGVIYSPKYTRGGGLEYSDFVWIQRRDHHTGQLLSLNITTLDSENNSERSTKSSNLRNLIEMFHTFRDPLKPIRLIFSNGQISLNPNESITYFPSLKSHMMVDDLPKVMVLEGIYGIVDLLIYKKYLDSISSSHISVPRTKSISTADEQTPSSSLKLKSDLLNELHAIAKEKYHIYDLNKLEKEMDTYCLTKLRLTTLTASDATTQQLLLQKEEKVMKLTKVRIFESFSTSTSVRSGWDDTGGYQTTTVIMTDAIDEKHRNIISNFIENHHLYEEELKEKLGIVFTPEQSDQVTNAYHRDEERKQWYTAMTHLAENAAFYGAIIGIPVMVLTALLKQN